MTQKVGLIKRNAGKGAFQGTIPIAGHDDVYPIFAFTHTEIAGKNNIFSFQDGRIKAKEYGALFEFLKNMSQKIWREIKSNRFWHMHEVVWGDTTMSNKKLPQIFLDNPVWQFKAGEERRIVGFFRNDNVFEIVWLDYDHTIYKDKKFNK